MAVRINENFINLKKIGIGGLNTFDDPSDIKDIELSDVKNMVFDDGFLAPREGSSLLYEKPSGETASPLQLMIAKTSDGVDYEIAIYGNKFYIRHEENDEWVKMNLTYFPSETEIRYGWVNWNNGRGDDRLYACNGVNNFIRWDMCVSRVSGDHVSGATTLTLEDGTHFPTSGYIVIKGNSGEFVKQYTARTGNVLTLSGTLGQAVGNESSVISEAVEIAGMSTAIGSILGKHQSRLFSLNAYGSETSGWYSKLNDPEDFTTGSTIEAASTFTIADGNGGITGFHDFGAFAVIEKEDSLHSFSIVISEDLGSKLDRIQPIISGDSSGPISQDSTVKINNALYYPTKTNGFKYIYPTQSGGNASVDFKPISQPIHNLVTKSIEYDMCRAIGFDNKVLWAVAREGGVQNTFVLVYDQLRNAWTKFANMAIQDFGVKSKQLHFIDSSDGSIYLLFNKTYTDNNNPYPIEATGKRFDLGKPSQQKKMDCVYVQGYMTLASDFYIDIMFDEAGILKIQSFRINKNTPNVEISNPLTNSLGQLIPGILPFGWVIIKEIGNLCFFRCYLGVDINSKHYNFTPRIRSNKEAFFGITALGINPYVEETIQQSLIVSPE